MRVLAGMPAGAPQLLAMQRTVGNRATADKVANGRSGLPLEMRRDAERRSGFDLGNVRVHRNSAEPRAHGANAVTRGDEIHLGPSGERSLGHELWHVVQQRQGRVQATKATRAGEVNSSAALEHEAERVGSTLRSGGPLTQATGKAEAGAVAQHDGWDLDALQDKIRSEGLAGVCNALSTAQLLGLIKPSAEDSTTGVTEENWVHVKALKKLLDQIVELRGGSSDEITMQFLHYYSEEIMEEGEDTWLDNLTDDSVEDELKKFRHYLEEKGGAEESDDEEERDTAYGAGADALNNLGATASGDHSYAEWTTAELGETVGDALDDVYQGGRNFAGVVYVRAQVEDADDGPGRYANHQFSVTFEAASAKFSIFDQTSGLAVVAASDKDTIKTALVNHLKRAYIDNPMQAADGPTTDARIGLRLEKSEADDDEEAEEVQDPDAAGHLGASEHPLLAQIRAAGGSD